MAVRVQLGQLLMASNGHKRISLIDFLARAPDEHLQAAQS